MVNPDLLLVIGSSTLGEGEPILGEKLMKAFLGQFNEPGRVPARVMFLNSGIYLTTTEKSVALDVLREFESAGCRISSCGTCLDYYNRADKLLIGQIGNMGDTVHAMLNYPKVLQV